MDTKHSNSRGDARNSSDNILAGPSTTQNQTLANKTAIVTGASRGIGAGIAYELAKRGAHVLITYTSPESTQLVEELTSRIRALENGSTASAICADLRSLSAPSQIVNAAAKAFSHVRASNGDPEHFIDILVNNAGCSDLKPLAEVTQSDFSSVYDLNVRAIVFLTQAVLPILRAPGRIINISSMGARMGFANTSLYAGSKAALEGMTRSWASELGPQGHTVNVVSPGAVGTDMMKAIPDEVVEMQTRQTPMQNRLGTVDDIAQIVAFLAEEGSRWITGQVLGASGGYLKL